MLAVIEMHKRQQGTAKTRIKEPKFKNVQPEISQLILSKNGFVKQIWPLPDSTTTRSDFLP